MSENMIEALRREAIEAGDWRMVATCESALEGDELAVEIVERVIAEAQEAAQ